MSVASSKSGIRILRARSVLLAGWLYLVPCIFAQNSAEPFSNLDLRLGLARNVSTDPLLESWNPGIAALADASTSFYAGTITLGVRYESYTPRQENLPAFRSVFARLGWGIRWIGPNRSIHELGVEMGNVFMVFANTYSGTKTESELGLGLYYRLQMKVSPTVGIFVRGSYTGILTRNRLNLFHFSSGIVVETRMPAWLKRILE